MNSGKQFKKNIMKKTLLKITLGLITILSVNTTYAQETEITEAEAPKNETTEVESESPFTIGVDMVSAYVWRGIKYSGPAIQPSLEYGIGGFAVGVWGSFDLVNGFNEIDTYASYTLDFGLSLGVTDYYYQGSNAFEFTDTTGSHALEINLNYELVGFSASANYIVNDTHAGAAGSKGGDMYFQLGYAFKYFEIFAGAGDGWHTLDGNFNISNVGISASKEFKLTEKIRIPMFAQIIVNPDRKEYDLVVGISL